MFANTTWTSGKATITGLDYAPGDLASKLVGLDFLLLNRTFATFSGLRVKQLAQSAGFTYRLNRDLVLNGGLVYNDYQDDQPYLYDATGRYVSVLAGVNWIF